MEIVWGIRGKKKEKTLFIGKTYTMYTTTPSFIPTLLPIKNCKKESKYKSNLPLIHILSFPYYNLV